MERVEGEPVDRWCERRRTGLHERLRLFLDVCTAVQYAHGQLVVHRDIKPSNILVDAEGRVRLLDFGIARALDDAEATRTQGLALTPAYVTPEQLRGAPASVAGDVWSLGVLLYRLLAGRLPFARNDGSPADLEAILRTDPQPPSRAVAAGGPVAARSLRGATDAIVARAMMKEPGRRYPSVDALAEDIRRHLAAQPVHARRGAWTYRTGRFLRRYRLPVTIAAVAVLALSVAVWQALSAAQRARLEAQRASLVKDFLLGLFELGDPDRSGKGRVDARTLRNWGGNRRLAGDDGTAEALYRRALDIFEEVLGPEHPETGHAYNSLGVLLANRGDLLAARDMMLRARRAFLARQADSPVLATLELNLAAIAARYGAWEAAQEGYDAALRRLRELFGEQHPQVGAAYMGLARLAVAAGEPGQALAHLQRAGAIHDAVFPVEHQDRLIAGLGRARALLMLSRVTEAAAVIDDLAVRMQAALPPSHPLQLDLATVQAERLLLEGRAAAAAERLDPVLDARRAQAATAPVSLADTLLLMTRIELARGRRDQARLLLDELQAATAQVRLPPAAAAQYARLHSRLH